MSSAAAGIQEAAPDQSLRSLIGRETAIQAIAAALKPSQIATSHRTITNNS